MLTDFVANARTVDVQHVVIERCAGYWLPSGTMSRAMAYLVFPFVVDLFRAKKISTKQARDLGYLTRVLRIGQQRGFHWQIERKAIVRVRALVTTLHERGYTIERRSHPLGEEQILPCKDGRRTWIRCPEHDDQDPSAVVNESGVVYCFACARVVGIARMIPEGVSYRPFLLRTPRERTPDAGPEDDPARRAPQAQTPVAPAPYSVTQVEGAGTPGREPRHDPRARPTGIIVLHEDEAGERYHAEPMPRGFILGRRFGDEGVTRRGRRGLARTYSSGRDLLDILRSAQRQQGGEKAMARGLTAAAHHERSGLRDHRGFLPDLYVGLDLHAHTTTRTMSVADDRMVIVPEGFVPACGRWVGVDLDGFSDAPMDNKGLVAAADEIRQLLERHPVFTGRMGLVRTSERGVQVVAELAETRWDLAGFYHDDHVRRMLAGLDRVCLDAVRRAGFEGGHADPTVHAPGRLVRRPGPRKTKLGTVYVARLVYATP